MSGSRKAGRTRSGTPRQPATIDGEATRIEEAASESATGPKVDAQGDPAPETAHMPEHSAEAAATASADASSSTASEQPAAQPGPADEDPRPAASSGADWGAPAGTGFEGPAATMPLPPEGDARSTTQPRSDAPSPSPMPSLIAAALIGLVAGTLGGYAASVWTRPAAPNNTQELAALQTQVKALASLRSEIAGGAKVAEQAARQAGESAAKPLADALAQARATLDAMAGRLDAMEGRVAQVAAESAKPQVPEEVAALTRQLETLRANAGERAQALETAAQDGARALERITGLEKNLAESGAVAGATARLAIVQRIRAHLAEGRPFRSEVEALAGLGVSEADLAALRSAADAPPAASDLAASLDRTIRRLNTEPAAQGAPQDVSDRVLGWLGDVVRVRRVDGTSGRTAPLVPVRDALADGRSTEAAVLFNALPADLRSAAGDAFADGLARRAAAEAVVSRLGSDAFTILGRSTGAGEKP